MAAFSAKLRSMATNTSKGVSQYMASPQDADSGKSATMNKFFNVKRRMTESLMSTVGKAQPTEDVEYETRKARFVGTEKQLQALRKHFVGYLEAIRSLTFASGEIGATVREIYTGAEAPYSTQIETFATSLNTLDAGVRASMDAEYLREVIEPLDRQLAAFTAVHERMRERELIKVDFDARLRKIKLLKEQGGGADPTKLPKKEAKLRRNAESLQAMTTEIYRDLDMMESQRMSTLSTALQRFAATQRAFFSSGLGSVTGLPDIPHFVPLRAPDMPVQTTRTAWQTVLAQGDAGISMPVTTSTSLPRPAAAQQPSIAPPLTAMPGTTIISQTRTSSTSEVLGTVPVQAPRPVPAIPVAAARGSSGSAALLQYRVLYPYTAANADEVSLMPGQNVTVVESHNDGWMRVRTEDGTTGFFPANYLSQVV